MNLYKESTRAINVLFVGGGRRVSLAKRFLAKGCRLFSYEVDANCPISEVATIIKGFHWKYPRLQSHLEDMCEKHDIKLVIPLQDEAIPLCCDLTVPCPASLEAAHICFDKREFESFLSKYSEYPIPHPMYNGRIIAKPRFGFNSRGISIIDCFDDYNGDRDNIVFQRYIEGIEYSVDCYFNRDSELVGYVPRQRVVVQGGEVIQSTTMNRNNPLYEKFGEFIARAFRSIRAVGPYCIQFIENDGNIYVIEANARFGGGVILSLEAGFDIIQLILADYVWGFEIATRSPIWKEDFSMTRYFSEHFYDNDSEVL
ncbi:ATP-grasp domain-containing protein [Candidatus Pacearchaeota archaeon]|jgi:carbamoyl-phosphate synthase large subunit|nr:ATP-grasp domain-containing protein [Candidatus Pacearchaeota archaeon]